MSHNPPKVEEPVKFEVMMDIEALAIHQSKAVVVSVGLLEFHLTPEKPIFRKQLHLIPDIKHQIMKGRIIDPKTVAWWNHPDRAVALKSWTGSSTVEEGPVENILFQIASFFADPETPLWANGIVYDVGNVEGLYEDFAVAVPWRYNSPRDARTIYKSFAQQRTRPVDTRSETYHDALGDCFDQVWRLWEYWPTRGLRLSPAVSPKG